LLIIVTGGSIKHFICTLSKLQKYAQFRLNLRLDNYTNQVLPTNNLQYIL